MQADVKKNTSRSKKRWPLILGLVIAILLVLDLAIGNFLVTYSIGRSGDGGNRNATLKVASENESIKNTMQHNWDLEQEHLKDFEKKHSEKTVSIQSDDGLSLSGGFYQNKGSHLWAIVIHGYRSSHDKMTVYGQHYYEKGYQVLEPDLRGCGKSEGNYIGMGWLDRKDILKWIYWIVAQDPEAKIVIHGVSMGGATTLMTSGEQTPDNVKAFVEDCGYTSVWDIFASEARVRFHIPPFPLVNTASGLAKIRAGYTFGEASALKQVSKCDKPMLFFHGSNDGFVPFDMEKKLYDAKPGNNKKLVVAEGAGHGQSVYLLGDEYWNDVFEFIGPYMGE